VGVVLPLRQYHRVAVSTRAIHLGAGRGVQPFVIFVVDRR
jgi:hypothetical protein